MKSIERAFAMGDGMIRALDHPALRSRLYRLASTGELQVVLPGVFAPAGKIGPARLLRALCLWCPHGVVHERTAMSVWLGEPITQIHFAAAAKRRVGPGVRFTCRRIPPPFVGHRAGIALATPAYAAAECAVWDEGRSLMVGLREGLIHVEELPLALQALAGTLGHQQRKAVVRAAERNPWSYAELLLQRVLLAAGISGWVANQAIRVGGRLFHPDLWFPSHRLVVEFDGYAEHSKRQQFHHDRERQNALVTAGYRVLRFTWEDLARRPDYIVATVRRALAAHAVG